MYIHDAHNEQLKEELKKEWAEKVKDWDSLTEDEQKRAFDLYQNGYLVETINKIL